MKITDTHVHIMWKNNHSKAKQMLKIANKNNIDIFAVSTNPNDFKETINFSIKNNLKFSLGLAPNYISFRNFLITKRMINKNIKLIFAIGEIGLDYENSLVKKKKQIKYFKKQLLIASKFQKPVLVHNKNESNYDIFNIFKSINFKNILVLHNYNGDLDMTKKWLKEKNVFFSIGNQAFYDNFKYVIDSIKIIPITRLLIETDSPGFPTKLNLNKTKFDDGDPTNIFYVIECLAKIKKLDKEEIIKATTRNAHLIV